MPDFLHSYLRTHEAGARAGSDLFHRAARNQRQKPYADALRQIAVEVEQDLGALRQLMRSLGTTPNPLLGGAAQLAERLGRLKPNGQLVRRSPLSDLVEVEACLNAVGAKRAGWQALSAAGIQARVELPGGSQPVTVETLLGRAEDQIDRLRGIHAIVAAEVLRPA